MDRKLVKPEFANALIGDSRNARVDAKRLAFRVASGHSIHRRTATHFQTYRIAVEKSKRKPNSSGRVVENFNRVKTTVSFFGKKQEIISVMKWNQSEIALTSSLESRFHCSMTLKKTSLKDEHPSH